MFNTISKYRIDQKQLKKKKKKLSATKNSIDEAIKRETIITANVSRKRRFRPSTEAGISIIFDANYGYSKRYVEVGGSYARRKLGPVEYECRGKKGGWRGR